MLLFKSLRVLIVDDDKDFLEPLTNYFSRIFKEVYPATSADEAIELLQKYAPNIVISDIDMPGKDGHLLAKEIHRIAPRTPLFFLSAMENSETSKHLADGFIKKPFFSKDDIAAALVIIEKRMEKIIGKCVECLYLAELDEFNYVQCELSGDLLPKSQMMYGHPITTPCPYLKVVVTP